MKRLILALAMVVMVSPAWGAEAVPEKHSGNYWMPICEVKTEACAGFVMGFDHGVSASKVFSDYISPYCVPEGATYGQRASIFHSYLESHPEIRHELAGYLYIAALAEAWPCP